MKKLMNWIFLSCFKATQLIEKKISFRISKKEQLQLTMHKTICNACRLYEKQSIEIEKMISVTTQNKDVFDNTDHKKFENQLIKKIESLDSKK